MRMRLAFAVVVMVITTAVAMVMTPHNQRKDKQNSQNHAANHIENSWRLMTAFLGGYNA